MDAPDMLKYKEILKGADYFPLNLESLNLGGFQKSK